MLCSHITHEAARKYGGIGAVLAGLITSGAYGRRFDQTLIYGPLFDRSGTVESRLENGGRVLYSGPDGYDAGGYGDRLDPVEQALGVGLVYGQRVLVDELDPDRRREVDVVLVDIADMPSPVVDDLKHELWSAFGLASDRYTDWDYEQYVRIAAPYLEIIEALFPGQAAVHLAHEYMGLPSALKAVSAQRSGGRPDDRHYFYAHEVAPARAIVENLPGHEAAFDNLLRLGLDQGRTLEDDFGSQSDNYRSELVKRAEYLTGVLAVSDNVRDQLRYFHPAIPAEAIKVVYNGVSYTELDYQAKEEQRQRVIDYCLRLFNYRPEIILTHVTRLVTSKGLWRDISFLYRLDELMAQAGLSGVYVLVSSLIASGRSGKEIAAMEADYGWPVLHRSGWPDLEGAEQDIYDFLSVFNARSRVLKGVFLNQFGFSPQAAGSRVPEGSTTLTLRAASDLEFGLSIYEPFGIAQLETFPFGGLPVLSRACGCSYLLEETVPEDLFRVVDFAAPDRVAALGPLEAGFLKSMSIDQRYHLEEAALNAEAKAVFERIQPAGRQERFERMQAAAADLGWEAIAERVLDVI